MKVAESKVYIALEGSGSIINPPDWLSEALIIDTYSQRYGWSFVKDLLEIDEIDVETFAAIQGIMNGENKKSRMDDLRSRLKR